MSIFYSPWRVLFNEPHFNFLYSALLEIWRCKIFRFFQDGGRTTWPMTSSLPYFISHGKFFRMSHVDFFVQYFRRYRGAKFFGFSKMAAEPRDWWRHQLGIVYSRSRPTWAKFGDSRCNGVDVVLQTDRQTDEKSVRDRGLAGICFFIGHFGQIWRPNHMTDDVIIICFLN